MVKEQDLREVMTDLKLIKEAVSKSDNIIRFIDAGGALRGILLTIGLLITAFLVVFYYLIERYGAFEAIPLNLTIVLFVSIGLLTGAIGYWKIRNFLHGARRIGEEMNYYRLLKEIYTSNLQALHLPYFAAIILLIVFLSSRGYVLYIIPFIAVLFGLLVISLSSLFFLREFYFLGLWLTATGILTLFTAEVLHPLVVAGITFATGFLLASLSLYGIVRRKEVKR